MLSPSDLAFQFPLSQWHKNFIADARKTLTRIIDGEDERLVLIVGPCSLHDEKSTYEYAEKLAQLAEDVSEKFFIIMRAYFEKPRTKYGWKGLLYDPTLDGKNDIHKGLELTRKILISLTERSIPCGCELLELITAPYYSELLTWGCIGARTSASQPHRQLASSLSFPVGFKNSTEGNIESAINGMSSAGHPHDFLSINSKGFISQTTSIGNPYCHLVLRGSDRGPNYQIPFFENALQKCSKEGLCAKIMVDCSHGNSSKMPEGQKKVFQEMIQRKEEGQKGILGMMLESHLEQGNQDLRFPLREGISITDSCLGWENARSLILEAAHSALFSNR